MTDVHDRQTRSRNMAAIKSRDTKPELLARKEIHKRGLRYSLRNKSLPGKPDFVLVKYKVAVFVHGCFWHKHNCSYFRLPQSNTQFWKKKINSNSRRDEAVIRQISGLGYRILIIWECSFKGANRERMDSMFDQAVDWIRGKDSVHQILVLPS